MKPKENYFKNVCALVESGLTISDSLDELGIDSNHFYDTISKRQKLELNQLKAANKAGRMEGVDIKELHEYFTSEQYVY